MYKDIISCPGSAGMTGLVVTLAMLSSDMSTFLAARSLQMKESRNAVCHHNDGYMGGGGGGGGGACL